MSSTDALLALLDRCSNGPRYRPGLPSYCRKDVIIREAVELGWVTYVDHIVSITDCGERALAGRARWNAFMSNRNANNPIKGQ